MKKLTKVGLILTLSGLLLLAVYALAGGYREVKAQPYFNIGANVGTTSSRSLSWEGKVIRSLDIDLAMGELLIETADIKEPILYYDEIKDEERVYYTLDADVKGQTLYIKDRYRSKRIPFIFSFLPRDNSEHVVRLVLPLNVSYKQVSIKLDMGSAEIKGLQADDFSMHLSMGGADLHDIKFSDTDLKLDMGSLEFKGGTIENSRMDLSMGSLEGSVDLQGRHEIISAMGSVDLHLPFAQDEATIYADIDLGGLTINNEEIGIHTRAIGDGPRTLEFEISMGSLDLQFEQ